MFSSIEIEILRDLYLKPEGEKIYYFYLKYNLSPDEIAKTLLYYRDLEFVNVSENLSTLTSKGRKWVFANRKKIFLTEREMLWKDIDTDDKTEDFEKLAVNKVYLPRINKIDPELINIKEKKARNGRKN